ncbi:MAG: ribonuclease H-like domain-containing protein [Vicinamibacterales bacterium]
MSVLADRLRGIVRPAAVVAEPGMAAGVADALGGRWAESRGRRYVVIDRAYGPGYRHGRVAIMDAMPPWPRLSLLGGPDPSRLLFIDLETTGVAGGAGTYAFLVGCGWFDGPTFRVRQFFLSTFAAETAVLDGLSELAGGTTGVVTFNGKSFDLPLIDTRFLFHRMPPPFAGVPHVDMLHPARRLWRAADDEAPPASAGCRLSVLERTLCGVARKGDVHGFEIPGRYFAYVRSGDARPLEAVLEHNRLDLVSLALLTARVSRLLEEGPAAARSAREALGLGRLYERGELWDLAWASYRRAIEIPSDVLTHAEAQRSHAVLCRRRRRFADAAAAWQRLLGLGRCPPHFVREATEALAIHHEHRLRNPRAARQFALQSLCLEATAARRHAVRHRLARLDRKLAVPQPCLFEPESVCLPPAVTSDR